MPGSLEISVGVKFQKCFGFSHLSSTLNQYTDNMPLHKVCTCHHESCACVCTCVCVCKCHLESCVCVCTCHHVSCVCVCTCRHKPCVCVCTCRHEPCACVCVAAEVLDSCKKVENQLVSFAAVGVVMDEEAVQEATSTCQAADKLIQVSHGVATSPHQWNPPQPLHEFLEPSACLHLLHGVETADNVAFTPPRSCDKLIIPSVPSLISCHIIT